MQLEKASCLVTAFLAFVLGMAVDNLDRNFAAFMQPVVLKLLMSS